MSDNEEQLSNSLDLSISDDNNEVDLNTDDDTSIYSYEEEGFMMLRPSKGVFADKFYKWSKISSKLDINNDELMLSHVFDYMNKYKTLKGLLSKTIPLFVNDGKLLTKNTKISEIEGIPLMILKEIKFKKINSVTSNYSSIINNLLANNNMDTPENLFGNLINAMTSGMQIRRVDSVDDLHDDLEDESDEELDGENIVNDNRSLNIVNQLLSMYNSNSTSIQSINNNAREKYKDQIEQMKAMGLTDENKLLQSLTVCDGNVEHAVNYYFGME